MYDPDARQFFCRFRLSKKIFDFFYNPPFDAAVTHALGLILDGG